MIALYEKALEVRNYKPNTKNRNVQLIKKFFRETQIKDFNDITPANVESYLCQLKATGLSAKTIENLRAFLPDHDIELAYELAELNGITVEITLALNTGLRMTEMQNLTRKDINFKFKHALKNLNCKFASQ